ncbi:superoxide dismutase family protein [Amycolatopsis viridis]|uniref:Cu-Zn family superoxide dismutase n=1 Tax=Amycolatopsis viridis TaxID=185678 RepID=A0ABX0SLZ8_9PSEU|nr:superoxide dismutase family protein [Amycolatopsis viridis]NIH77963.1 Cu-Zn family superoxide dismutase [Amycolatopsis viridis]
MRIVPLVLAAAALPALCPAEAAAAQAGFGSAVVRYRADLVPDGATVRAFTASVAGTLTTLSVRGLLPSREYGAHVHTKPCGAAPADSGPHYQHVADPVQPSTDPAYANPRNEIWLDLTTSADGSGFAVSHVDWTYGDRLPGSVVLHETHTHTDPGHAGTAGGRLACLNLEFGPR